MCSAQSKTVSAACKADDEVFLLEGDCINLDLSRRFHTMNSGSIRASRKRESIVSPDDGHSHRFDTDFL